MNWYTNCGKRCVDVVLGSLIAVLVTPVIVVLAAGSALALRAWPVFVQRRVGRDSRLFRCPKIRTLHPDAPRDADKYTVATFDIPKYCALLRRMHLDELPQLWLVPLGRMSLVGPRPEIAELNERYPAAFAYRRVSIRPGCTGLWQVSSDSARMIYEVSQYDDYYLLNIGFLLDAWILFRTVADAVHRPRLASLDRVPGWTGRRRQVAEFGPTPTELEQAAD